MFILDDGTEARKIRESTVKHANRMPLYAAMFIAVMVLVVVVLDNCNTWYADAINWASDTEMYTKYIK